MNFQAKIEKSLFKKKEKSAFEAYSEILFYLAKEFGWTPQTINELPIPIVYQMVESLNDYYKEQSKAQKRKR
jgi:hypothetical protein